MATEKLKSGEIDLDDDLNFDEFDFGDNNNAELKDKKSRNPVLSVATGLGKGVVDKFKSPSFLAKVAEDALPPEYGQVTRKVNDTIGTVTSLYDEAIREIKPSAARLAAKVDKLVPAEASRLKKFTGRISEYLGNRAPTMEDSREVRQEQGIALELNTIFGAQQEHNDKLQARENAENKVQQAIETKRFKGNFAVFNSIDQNTTKLAAYTTTVTNAYQKKSLELQFRSYFLQAEQLTAIKEHIASVKDQNLAIIRNTALPEYTKIKESERFKELAKNKFYDNVRSSIFGNGDVIKLAGERIRAQMKQFISGVKMGMEQVGEIADAGESLMQADKDMKESGMGGMNKTEMAAQMAGSGVGSWLGGKVSKGLKKIIPEDSWLHKTIYKGADIANNTSGYINDFKNSQLIKDLEMSGDPLKMKIADALRWGTDLFREGDPNLNLKDSNNFDDLNNPSVTGFDNKAAISLNQIIPGYLARIQREISILRTGNEKTPLTLFDYSSGKFKSDKLLAIDLKASITKSIKDTGYKENAERHATNMSKDAELELDKEEISKIATVISKLSEVNMVYTPDNVRKSKAYEEADDKTKEHLETILTKNIEQSDNSEYNQNKFTVAIKNTKDSAPDIRAMLQKYVDAGYGSLLEKEGIVKGNGKGGYSIESMEKYMDFIRKESGVDNTGKGTSDINAKESISKFSPKEALNKIKKTKIYNWFYRQGKGPEGEHTGPMAQDVKQNFGEEAAPGGTKIDLISQNGNNMAAIQALDEKIDKKSINQDSSKILALIRKDTSTLVSLSKEAMKMIPKQVGSGPVSQGSNTNTAGGYKGALSNIASGSFDLVTQLTNDSFKYAKKTFEVGRDKVAKPFFSLLGKAYQNTKDPLANGLKSILTKATELGSSALGLATKAITETLPAGLKQIAGFGGKVKDFLTDVLNTPIDLYLPGINVPVLRAKLIEAGMYIDKNTGKVITKLSDITGEVVDKAGNIVLSNADYLKGLYDKNGKEVKLKLKTLSGIAADYALKGAVRLKDHAVAGYKRIKDLANSGYDKLHESLKGKKLSIPNIDLGLSSDKTYNVLVQIKNIMLRQWEGKTDVEIDDGIIKKETKSIDLGETLDKAKDKSSGLFTKLSNKATEVKDKLKDKTKDTYNSAKERLKRLSEKKPVEAVKADLESKYKSSKNVIDSIKDKATGFFKKDEEGNSTFSKLKEKGTSAISGVKAKGLKGSLTGLAGGLLSKFSDKKDSEDKTEAPNQIVKSDQVKRQEAEAKAKSEKVDKTKPEGKINWSAPKGQMSPIKFNDSDGDGDRDGNAKDRLAAIEERKKANHKDFVKADLAARYKSDKNIIDTMMEKVGGLFSFMKNGVGGLITTGLSLFTGGGILKMLGKGALGLGKGALALGKGVATVGGGAISALGSIGKGVQAVGSLLPGAGKLASVASMARNVMTVAGLASGGTLSAVAGIGSAIVSAIGAPVILGALATAAVGYGAYKLYKYLKRDSVDEFSSIRLKQYGFNTEQTKKYNHYALGLENYLQDGRISYNNGTPDINSRKVDMEDILTLFDIDKGNDEAKAKLSKWIEKRFKPFFLTHIAALYSLDNKAKLNEIKNLKTDQKIKYLKLTGYESGPYDYDTSPIVGIDSLNDTSQIVGTEIKALTEKFMAEQAKDSKESKDAQIGAKKPEVPKALQTQSPKIEVEKKEDNPKTVDIAIKEAKSPFEDSINTGEESSEPKASGSSAADGKKLDGSVKPGNVVTAGGAVRDGSGGDQYIKLNGGVTLAGLKPELLKMFKGMAQEYGETTGKSILVTSGTRTTAEQEALYKKDPSKAAKPGKSLHEFGLALDVDSKILNELDQMGLMRKYGFTRPVGGEPWHTEPAGIQVNLPLAKQDTGFASTAIAASLNKGGGGAGSIPGSPLGKRDINLALATMGSKATVVTNDKDKLDKTEQALKPAEPVQTALADNKQTGISGKSESANTVSALDPKATKPATGTTDTKVASSSPATTDSGEAKPAIVGSSDAAKPTVNANNKTEVKKVIEDTAKKTGGEPEVLVTFAAIESGLNPNAKAGTSSASGLYQFTKGTWNEQVSKFGSKYGIAPGTPPTDVVASTQLASEYIKQNEKALKSVVQDPGAADIYAAHFLGAGGAKKLYSASENTPADSILPDAAKANKAIFYKDGYARTTGEIKQVLAKKVETKAKEYNIPLDPNDVGGKATGTTDTSSKTDSSTAAPSGTAPKTTTAPSESAAPATPKTNTITTPTPSLAPFAKPAAKESTDGQSAMASTTSTSVEPLNKLVAIQTEMLNVMKSIYSVMGSGSDATPKGQEGGNAPPARQQRVNIQDSALNLTRA